MMRFKFNFMSTKAIRFTLTFLLGFIVLACSNNDFTPKELNANSSTSSLVEQRINRAFEKRMRAVSRNPLYVRMLNEIASGRNLLKKQQYDQAFEHFGTFLQNKRYRKFSEFGYGKYYMAKTLLHMKAYYASLLYYADVLEKDKLRPYTHESLRQAIRIAQHLKDDELILYLASVIDSKKVPKSLKEEFRYFVAKDLYQKNNDKRAVKLLMSISKNNRLYFAARYLLGAIAVKNKRLKKSVQFFKSITTKRNSKKYYEQGKIKQLAHLALGRVYYEMDNYPLSIFYYKKVDQDKNYYPQSLYESAWALFNMHKFNESLSVLHSVNSPFFEQVYFLKSYLLKGAIFLELCLYDDALQALTNVEGEFKTLANQIDTFARQNKNPRGYYKAIIAQKKSDNKKSEIDYAYRDLFNLASANRDFWGVHEYILSLDKERKTFSKFKSSTSKLIKNLIQQKEKELQSKASYLAGQKLVQTRELIRDFFALKDFLRYEIVSTERKILQTRSLRLAPPVDINAKLIRPEFTESLKESLVWWEYTGEYWADETGYYLYNLESICKKDPKKKTSKK